MRNEIKKQSTRTRTTRSPWLYALCACLLSAATTHAQFGGYGPPTFLDLRTSQSPFSVIAEDFDMDGDNDAFIVGGNGQHAVLENDGSGGFTLGQHNSPLITGFYAAKADFDLDGDVDVVSTAGGVLSVAVNNGDGTFSTGWNIAFWSPSAIGVGDFDADGDPDIVLTQDIVNQNDRLIVYLNDGTGAFNFHTTFGQGLVEFSGGVGPVSLDVGDLNADGKLDIVFVNRTRIAVAMGNGDGTFVLPNNGTLLESPSALRLADVNGDAVLDSLSTGRQNLSVRFGNGDGTFGAPMNYPGASLNTEGDAMAIADVDGDGDLDVGVTVNTSLSEPVPDPVEIFLNNGDGTFAAAQPFTLAQLGIDATPGGIAFTDVDGNGTPDVIALPSARNNRDVAILINQTPVVTPNNFALVSPPDGSVDLPLPETVAAWPFSGARAPLTWDIAIGFGVSYTLTVATDPALANVVLQQAGLTETVFDMPQGVLAHSTTYYWSVTASNSVGDTVASPSPFSFSTLCLTDLNGDRVLDIFDFLEFQNNFVQGCNR